MTTIHLTRRRAVAAALCAPVAGIQNVVGTDSVSDPFAALRAAYAAFTMSDREG